MWTSLWDAPEDIPHIRLVRAAEVALRSLPATANVIAKLAHGIADDLLTNALLAARIPRHRRAGDERGDVRTSGDAGKPATLARAAYEIVEPGTRFLGRTREPAPGGSRARSDLLAAIDAPWLRRRSLAGKRVAITAGPTREAYRSGSLFEQRVDRHDGHRTRARSARCAAPTLTLLLGPTQLEPPPGVHVVRVTTARELYGRARWRTRRRRRSAIATAAVADWRPAETQRTKVKKNAEAHR